MDYIDVKPGQIWKDNDPRVQGRQIVVERIDDGYAFCRRVWRSLPLTRIRLDRFRGSTKKGYSLVVAGSSAS